MLTALALLLLIAMLAVVVFVLVRRSVSRARFDDWLRAYSAPVAIDPRARRGLTRWIGLAGYWHAEASAQFLIAQAGAVIAGAVAAWLMHVTGVTDQLIARVSGLPGAMGEMVVSVLSQAPWTVFLLIVLIPVLRVRAARRRLVREVEADLPLVLEIFAALAEAGLGFDASLARLLDATPEPRPLHLALRYFQRDIQGGVPRVQALRHVSARLDVASVTVFISALVQAEQVGASIATTLRRQADDVRERRRERVAMLGQILPVKLMFPLVICFLPGIFLTTLGPAILQMVEVAGAYLRQGR